MIRKNKQTDLSHHPVNCYICMEPYSSDKKPLILVCGHTFCEVCLQNLFLEKKEIQCCFCKIITNLDKFDDMIINYAVLNLAEYETSNTEVNCKHQNDLSKLSYCRNCKAVFCSECESEKTKHFRHRVQKFGLYIEEEGTLLKQGEANWKTLGTMLTEFFAKSDRKFFDIFKKEEKKKFNDFFEELTHKLEEIRELSLKQIDKSCEDIFNLTENFKSEAKEFNSNSIKFHNILEDFTSFNKKSKSCKESILQIYNVNKTLQQIGEFNAATKKSVSNLADHDKLKKLLSDTISNRLIYKTKLEKFLERMKFKLQKDPKQVLFKFL